MANELLKQAQELLSLQDVYVREAHAFAVEEFDPTLQLGNVSVQFRLQPGENIEHCELKGEKDSVRLVRFPVHVGMRILRADVNAAEPITREQLWGEITAVFIVKYLLTHSDEQPTEEMLSVFTDNAIHHMWPYWREFLQATTARLRLPAVVLPMRKGLVMSTGATAEEKGKRT